jgi:hypothetical protein
VPLHFDAQGSVFVVFEGSGAPQSRSIRAQATMKLASVDGPWKVAFPPNFGAPEQAEFPALASWTQNSDAGVKYFSGTATYMKQIDAPQEWFKPNSRVMLDLGSVKEMAEVLVNGKPIGGVLWKPPFAVDVTGALKPGSNEIRVKVTNLWPNRMIGDLQAGAAGNTWTGFRPFKADSPLLESGLLGPVTVEHRSQTLTHHVFCVEYSIEEVMKRTFVLEMTCGFVFSLGFLPIMTHAQAARGPVALRVDNLTNPLGIDDPAPLFSWRLRDPAAGARQTAYEVTVASTAAQLSQGKADEWTSGRLD